MPFTFGVLFNNSATTLNQRDNFWCIFIHFIVLSFKFIINLNFISENIIFLYSGLLSQYHLIKKPTFSISATRYIYQYIRFPCKHGLFYELSILFYWSTFMSLYHIVSFIWLCSSLLCQNLQFFSDKFDYIIIF